MPKSISQQLKAAIENQGLSIYGAALTLVKAEGTDTPTKVKAAHKRLTAYTSDSPPKSIVQLEEACEALGLTITIK